MSRAGKSLGWKIFGLLISMPEITLVLFSSPDKFNFKNFKMAPYFQKLYQHFEITLVLFSSPDKINFKSLSEMAFKIA